MTNRTWVAVGAAALAGIVIGVGITQLASDKATDKKASDPVNPTSSSVLANNSITKSLIQAQIVEVQDIVDTVQVNGKIALNGLNVHQISSRVSGRVDKLLMVEGSSVKASEPLAWIYSPEFISAQNEFLLALRTVRSLKNQPTQELLEDANATLDGARNKLRILGARPSDITQLENKGVAQEYMAIASPITGKITKRNVDPGGYLDTGSSLGSVADMSSLWFLGNVFEADLPKLKEGQIANIRVTGVKLDNSIQGRISFVSPTVDSQTHAVVVRVDIPNPSGQFKPDMFARADIHLGTKPLPVVPRSAVVQDGAESFVVIQKSDGAYARVSVTVVPANDADHLAISSGVHPGDKVVIEGGVLVDRALVNAAKDKSASNKDNTNNAQVKP